MLLLTGSSGQLGRILSHLLPDALCPASDIFDITSEKSVQDFMTAHPVTAIINCAAYTAVDLAEDEHGPAFAINAKGPENLAKTGIPLIHISTDYVFDGTASRPYQETDNTNPQSVYGHSKLAGENAILEHASAAAIIRTSWLHSFEGNNFVKTMHRLGTERHSLNVVYDQIGTPTYAPDLAEIIVKFLPHLQDGKKEIYHYSNQGVCSWYDFAYTIMEKSGLACQINPISSAEYPTKAKRPYYSVMDKSKIKEKLGITIPHWTEGLEKCLKQFS